MTATAPGVLRREAPRAPASDVVLEGDEVGVAQDAVLVYVVRVPRGGYLQHRGHERIWLVKEGGSLEG